MRNAGCTGYVKDMFMHGHSNVVALSLTNGGLSAIEDGQMQILILVRIIRHILS